MGVLGWDLQWVKEFKLVNSGDLGWRRMNMVSRWRMRGMQVVVIRQSHGRSVSGVIS